MKEQCELQQANEGKLKTWPKVAIIVLNWDSWRDRGKGSKKRNE